MNQRWVLASANVGKLAEMRALLATRGVVLNSLADFGVAGADETGLSFTDNALIKARHAAAATGLPALADDSGLTVDALAGAPGVFSARYAGEHGNAPANNDKLLTELAGVDDAARGAAFVCCIALCRQAEDPAPLVAMGLWRGRILQAPRGAGGFGYDPLFFDPEAKVSAAELAGAYKNRVSHRGRACRRLMALLDD